MTATAVNNPPELKSTFVDAATMPWQSTDFDGIEMKILYKDDEGRSTILFRMAPGAVVPLHEHTDLEQTFMLEGSLADHEGEVTAGNFVWRPGGNVHVAHAPHGASFRYSIGPTASLTARSSSRIPGSRPPDTGRCVGLFPRGQTACMIGF
jgi:quercetin dioxygenase-like cupin family protein